MPDQGRAELSEREVVVREVLRWNGSREGNATLARMIVAALDRHASRLGDAEPVATEADQPCPGAAGDEGEQSSVDVGPEIS